MLLALVIAIASITPSVSSEFIRDAAKAVQKPSKGMLLLPAFTLTKTTKAFSN